MITIVLVVTFILVVVALVKAYGALARGRCPQCGAGFGRVVSSTTFVSVYKIDGESYNPHTERMEATVGGGTGYLVVRRCRKCNTTWERLETT